MLTFLNGPFLNVFRLDIVGFLAILGEASILANAQVSTNSPFFLLPRLLPAPQALIRISRPERLSPHAGKVLGAYSGNICGYVNYIAHLLHDGDHLEEYSVRCQRITLHPNRPSVHARLSGPLTWLSILGCLMSVAILALAVVKRDGMAMMAVLLLSVLSTIIGIGSRWSLQLPERESKRGVPCSDVVIRYPHGAFIVVKCEEDVARELYWHPETCRYHVRPTTYRLISLVATLMLMFAVIFLSNAEVTLQLCFGAAYIILNAAYWTAAALPQRWNWDLSRFHVKEVPIVTGDRKKNYTAALWKAIAITKSVEWVHNGVVAPRNQPWRSWLEKADEMARVGSQAAGLTGEAGLKGRGGKGSAPGVMTGLSRGGSRGSSIELKSLGSLGSKSEEGEEEKIVIPEWDCHDALTEFLNPDPAARNV